MGDGPTGVVAPDTSEVSLHTGSARKPVWPETLDTAATAQFPIPVEDKWPLFIIMTTAGVNVTNYELARLIGPRILAACVLHTCDTCPERLALLHRHSVDHCSGEDPGCGTHRSRSNPFAGRHTMSHPVNEQSFNVESVELATEALLREHPDALVCGLASDGLIAPIPATWRCGARPPSRDGR